MMRRSTLSTPLTLEFAKPNWLKFIPQTSPDTHYSSRYLITQFPLERIMVKVLLYLCCATQINSIRKLGRGAVMRPFVKRSIPHPLQLLLPSSRPMHQKGRTRLDQERTACQILGPYLWAFRVRPPKGRDFKGLSSGKQFQSIKYD